MVTSVMLAASAKSRCDLFSTFLRQERYNAAAANPIGFFPDEVLFSSAFLRILIA